MTRASNRCRPAFTLLEVLLATGIAVLLMSGLYVAMHLQVRHAQIGREIVEQGNLIRGVLIARLSNDISGTLGTINLTANTSAANAAGGSPSTASSATTTPSSTTPTTSNTSPSTPSSSGSPTGTATTSTAVVFNLGLQGDSNNLILYTSRYPRDAASIPLANQDGVNPIGIADLRRICYWMVNGNGGPSGLARQEIRLVTSDDAMSALPPDIPDDGSCVIAEEVKNITFSYFDGDNWQTSWDGTQPGPDGVTPVGPPIAIGMDLEIVFPDSPSVKKIRHVVTIPTANGMGTNNVNAAAAALLSNNNNSNSNSSSNTGP
jgi:type II secretory pathway pseudopilin PulG